MLRKLFILSLGFILLGCNDSGDPELSAANCNSTVGTDLVTKIQSLDIFEQPAQSFSRGESILMDMTLTNTTSEVIDKSYGNGSYVEFRLKNSFGDVLWSLRRSDPYFHAAFVVPDEMLANETRNASFEWDQVSDLTDTLVPINESPLDHYFLQSFFFGVTNGVDDTEVACIMITIN